MRSGHICTFILSFGVLLTSCSDFLDETPDNRVDLDNLEKASQLLTNAYSTASYAFTDWMSDNVGWTRGTNLRPSHLEMYAWEDVTTGPTEFDTPDFYWFNTYNAIAHANEVLAILDELPANTDEEKERKDAIESEALLTRAYGHFMLVNLFAEHTSNGTESEPGIPYVKTPETTFIGTYERESIRRVYREIEDDLLDGLELVNDNFFSNSGKYHFNRNAALAFASRFYLFRGDFVRCLDYSNRLLGTDPSSFIKDLTSTEFRNASSSIQAYPQLYTSPDLPSNLLLMRKESLVQRTDFSFGPNESFYGSLFGTQPFPETTDERENPAFVKGDNALFPVRYQSLFERNSLNSNVGTPYHIAVAFTGEEVLLNKIESNIALNNLNEAIVDLQLFVERRYSGAAPVVTLERLRSFFGEDGNPSFTDQLVLLNYILLERRKEFIAQGLRWFDIKRYGFAVSHTLQDEISTIRLSADDPRKVLQIPQSAVDVGGLEPNPR
ncbi:RagB/SusD family nutrient uptake outer membrane protein [Fulvivirga sp. M361]|uniref:RagB/SusD family nutrient uptake outer membrane protein n=1 Tax=Fulvivirga sp. M361 TaxID=2594266 RepID=UPI001623FCE8|nr:RagB/SusD family nutrient uptake outer membrane protein [Fulvivirga sp. M361]